MLGWNVVISGQGHAGTITYAEGPNSIRFEAPLVGVPSDPRPGAPSPAARFTPHALGSLAWDSGTYAYDGAGNIVSIGTDNYLYDGVQRLKQSSTKGTPETYTYDGFGNMQTRTNTIIPTVQPSTNRYDGYLYNEVGAVTSDGSYAFSYDALGQPLSKIYNNDSSTLEYYIYTPGDERIGVQRAGWWTWSVRDEGGKVLRQYKSSATNPSAPALWLEDFVWRDGLLLGSQRPVEMGGRRHFHLDHLGSPRLVTSDNGQMVSYHDYYPFGDEHSPVSQEGPSAGGFDREDPLKFTGHERDYAGGMGGEDGHTIDDMHARYYNGGVGRFLSFDPALDLKNTPPSPQAWNRYAYARNSPIRFLDPDGRLDYDAKVLGSAVHVHIDDNLPIDDQKALQLRVNAGIASLNANKTKLSASEIRIIGNIKTVNVMNLRHGQRSGVEASTGKLTFTTQYVRSSSSPWLASAVAHDGEHVEIANTVNRNYMVLGAIEEEKKALQFQLRVGRKIGLSGEEADYLHDLINNPEQWRPYVLQPGPGSQ